METNKISFASMYQHPEFIAAMKRVRGGAAPGPDFGKVDKAGRWIVPQDDLQEQIQKDRDAAAQAWHGSDIRKRIDELNPPFTRGEIEKILKGNFPLLKKSMESVESGRWCFYHGEPGLKKTSLALRVVIELFKKSPSAKAIFLSAPVWVHPSIEFNESDLKGIVIVDDLGRVNFGNEYNANKFFMLFEALKRRRAKVLITSQLSLKEIHTRHARANPDAAAVLDRVRGQSTIFKKFTGRSLR